MRVAGLAGAGPAIFDAGEAFAIEVDGTFGAGASAKDSRVKDGYRYEDDESNQQPPWRERFVVEREPGGDQYCNDYEETEISETAMEFFEVRDLRLAGLLALFVFFGGREIGRMHRGIIAYPCALVLCCRGVGSDRVRGGDAGVPLPESFM